MKSFICAFSSLCLLLLFACDDEQSVHTLTVNNGSGSGDYVVGIQVPIQADTAPAGQAFYRWEGDTTHVEETRAPMSRLTMPLEDIEVTATFKDLPTYMLMVNNGIGSGSYLEGARVWVEANAPAAGEIFSEWQGDTQYLATPDSSASWLEMPAEALSLTATYETQVVVVSFAQDILPIFNEKCNSSGCHDPNSNYTDLTSYVQARANRFSIKDQILSGAMPSIGSLSQAQIDLIVAWVEQGAPE